MITLSLKNPLGRVLNNTGSAGPRRLLTIGAVAVAGLGVVGLVWMRSDQVEGPAQIAQAPKVDPLPGGRHSTPAYTDLAIRHDQEVAARAAAEGQSSVATMPGSDTAVRVPPAAPVVTLAPRASEAGVGAPAAPAPFVTPVRPVPNPYVAPAATSAPPQSPKPDENQTKAYAAAIAALLNGWGGKAQATEVILRSDEPGLESGDGARRRGGASPGDGLQSVAATQPVPNAPRIGGRPAGQVLMPAGRGVYGRTVLAASSDQGGPVVVEALSGPVAGNRMTGSFDRREDRLVVKLNSITLQDGTQQAIDALVIAPDTMETSVASNVDQHYASRFILPVAAAFVSGLGQAFAQSNSTSVLSPLGGVTSVQRLNLGQQFGVGAGVAGAQLGAILHDAAPKGPTVSIEANVNVGVVFLAPLVVGGRQ